MTGSRAGYARRAWTRLVRNLGKKRRARRAPTRTSPLRELEALESRHLLAVTLGADTFTIPEAGGAATLTATLSEVREVAVDVDLEVSGNATEFADYFLSSKRISIPAGELTGSVTLTATQDTTDEDAEAVIIEIAQVVNDLEAEPQLQTILIVDDDPPPTVALSINDGAIRESGGVASLTAALSAVSELPVTIDLAYSGTAIRGEDFTAPEQLVIPPGSLLRTLAIATIADTVDEIDESITITVTGISNGSIEGPLQFETTILDDDILPVASLNIDSREIFESQGVATVTASLSAPSGADISLPLVYSGAAERDVDYTGPSAIVIPRGTLFGTATITATDDEIAETAESIVIGIGEPANAVGDGRQVTTSIIDDDGNPAVSFSITPAAILEDTQTAVVTATLTAPTGRDVVIALGYDGTAVPDVDFAAVEQITIPAGSVSGTVELVPIADRQDEGDETVTVFVTDIQGAALPLGPQGTIVIQDDDPVPSVELSLDEAVLPEAAGLAIVTATLSEVSSFDVVVALGFTGTAARGSDYSVSAAQIVVPAGSTSAVAAILATQDGNREPDETIVVDVIVVANGREAGVQRVTATIEDDDELPIVNLSSDVVAFTENGGSATITASLSASTAFDVTVDLALNGSANVGEDYEIVGSQQVVIPAGNTEGMISLTALDDLFDEGAESILVEVEAVENGVVGAGQVSLTVLDDDRVPEASLSMDNEPLPESGGTAQLTVTLSEAVGRAVTLELGFAGAAAFGEDYTASSSQIVIPPGATTGSIILTAENDSLDEPDEQLSVDVLNVINANIAGDTTVSTTILDDDPAPAVTLTLEQATLLEAQGTTTVTAQLASVSAQLVTIDLLFTGTASPGADYLVSATQIVIAPGDLSGTAVITAAEDFLDEPGESIVVEISSATNATEVVEQVVEATILDDDDPPSVTLQSDTSAIDESGVATVTSVLSSVSGRDVTVQLGFAGSANLNGDYFASDLELLIPAGQTSASAAITAIQDTLYELDETVLIEIASVTNAVELSDQSVEITIVNDDDLPQASLAISNPAIVEGAEGTEIRARLSEPAGVPSLIRLEFAGTAVEGEDFAATDSQIVIPPGELSGTLTINALLDELTEAPESIVIQVGDITNAVLSEESPLSATIVDGLGELASITGRAYHDRDSSSARDEGEEYLLGWTVELVDADGQVVARQQTRERDFDDSLVIDPETESGWYEFQVLPGDYTVREVAEPGWRITAPTNALGNLAYQLDQSFDFFVIDGFFENWGGQGERWLQAAADGNQWFYVTTSGELWQWDTVSGAPLGSTLSGTLVATLDASFHADPQQLVDVPEAEAGYAVSVIAGEVLAAFDFGNLQLASISGRSFGDLNGNGRFDLDDQYLNDWAVELLDSAGEVVAVQVTRDLDLDQDGTTDRLTETGWYRFEGLDPGDYTVRQVSRAGWRQTFPLDLNAQLAVALDQQFDFFTTGNLWEDFGGSGERWLQSAANSGGWFFITPAGELVEWDNASGVQLGTPLAGTLIATLPTVFFDDPTRLIDAVATPLSYQITLESGQVVTERDFGHLPLVTLAPPATGRPPGDAFLVDAGLAKPVSLPQSDATPAKPTTPTQLDAPVTPDHWRLPADQVDLILRDERSAPDSSAGPAGWLSDLLDGEA